MANYGANLLSQAIGLDLDEQGNPLPLRQQIDNPVLDPSISLDQLKKQAESPMFVQPSEFGTTTMQDVQTKIPVPTNYMSQAINEANNQVDSNINDDSSANVPANPLSKREQLLQEYNSLVSKDREDIQDARSRDRMLKFGGAIGDNLATLINAQNQMNVKAPGVRVEKGAGLADLADKFQTSPEIASDMKSRREDLLAQYKAMSEGDSQVLQERRVKAYEDQVKAMEKKVNKTKIEGPSFEEKENIKANVKEKFQTNKENREIKESIEKALPTVNDQIKNVKEALNLIEKSSVIGTGPLDQYVAGTTPKGQLLKKALGNIQLDTLVTKFQGMSRAIDTETDRKFFQETQPSMSNFESTNKAMLADILQRLEGIKKKSEQKLNDISSQDNSFSTKKQNQQPVKQTATEGTILRRDPKSGRVVEYDATTKKPIRFVD